MKPFKLFSISSYEWNPELLIAKFYFDFDGVEQFCEEIDFSPMRDRENFPLKQENLDKIPLLLSHLHLALGVSYYKLYPTKEILVKTLDLTEKQKYFWQTFYLNGLGEFFYRNQLDPCGLAQFISEGGEKSQKSDFFFDFRSLVLFGGGKDSLVSVEMLKKQGIPYDLFSFGKDYPLHAIAQEKTGAKRLIVKRTLDLPQLQRLGDVGYYNGHVPITGTICFVSLVVSALYGYNQVITSLEKSADFGNTEYFGMHINHQWSKSKEFEELFNAYVRENILEKWQCRSLIRDRYEIKVIKDFARYNQYFHFFSSCNRNFHLIKPGLQVGNLWCCTCPKCAFMYTLLRAFLEKEKVNSIFGADLFEKEALETLFRELLGISGIKPFECVGTNEEMILACRLIFQKEKKADSVVMKIFVNEILPQMHKSDFELLEEKLLH